MSDELDDATRFVGKGPVEPNVSDETIVVSRDSVVFDEELDEATDPGVSDATVVVSRGNPLTQEEQALLIEPEIPDGTVVVSRTNPFLEEATTMTSSQEVAGIEEATTTGSQLFRETSQPVPVPTFEPQGATIAEEPIYSSVKPAEEAVNPIASNEDSFVQRVDSIAEPQVVVTSTFEEIAPPVVTRSGPSKSQLMAKNSRRRKMSSLNVIIMVVIAAVAVGGTLAYLLATNI